MSNVHGLEYCYDLYIIRNGNQLAFAVPINRLLSFLASVPFYDRHYTHGVSRICLHLTATNVSFLTMKWK